MIVTIALLIKTMIVTNNYRRKTLRCHQFTWRKATSHNRMHFYINLKKSWFTIIQMSHIESKIETHTLMSAHMSVSNYRARSRSWARSDRSRSYERERKLWALMSMSVSCTPLTSTIFGVYNTLKLFCHPKVTKWLSYWKLEMHQTLQISFS